MNHREREITIEAMTRALAMIKARADSMPVPIPPGFDPAHPIYVNKGMLVNAHLQDLIQSYDVPHDVYKVEGFWCKTLPEIPSI